MNTPTSLLIIACSATKRQVRIPTPAIEVYDGPTYRVLRKNAPDDGSLFVGILSAKYGLIASNHPIWDYDQRMTRQIAIDMREDVRVSFLFMAGLGLERVYVEVGKVYRQALPDDLEDLVAPAEVTWGSGPIGVRCANLKRWLLALKNSC